MSPLPKKPDILPVMIGTAGHVDHGKTSLVKLLTGCDTDRLKEEKERGLSINLGFAPCMLPGNRMVGIIDVPGHLDFIRNMVAGAASMDILMLIIAADDSIMPQTREHLQIIRLLRTPQLMIVVTKIDLVDPEMLELVLEEIKEFTKETGYPTASVLPVSNITLDGISQVRKELDQLVSEATEKHDKRAFRMNIERIFSVKGYGTVATGIPTCGEIGNGDKVLLLPCDKSTRVRAIQNYKHDTDHTGSNICAAINLVDISTDELHRGMTLASPLGHYRSSKFILAEVQNDGSKYTIRQNMGLRFHYGTANVSARVSFLSGKSLAPGEKDFVKIRLAEPVTVVSGDRFILRRLSPSVTLGGGTVLNNTPQKIKENDPCLPEAIKALKNGDYFLAELLSAPDFLYRYTDLVKLTHLAKNEDAEIKAKLENNTLIDLSEGAFLVAEKLALASHSIKKHLSRHHHTTPYSWGIDAAEFANLYDIKSGNFAKFATAIPNFDKEINYSHNRLALASFEPAINRNEMQKMEKLMQIITQAGINAPAIGDIATTLDSNKKEINKLIRILSEEGKVLTIGKKLLETAVFNESKRELKNHFRNHDLIQINEFRDMTGASRNFAVALLEKFDATGITCRTKDGRELL
jgi:selenocysteine-specific elongation factor